MKLLYHYAEYDGLCGACEIKPHLTYRWNNVTCLYCWEMRDGIFFKVLKPLHAELKVGEIYKATKVERSILTGNVITASHVGYKLYVGDSCELIPEPTIF